MSRSQMIKRRSAICSELVKMSRDGWRSSKYTDYAPLEAEWHALNHALRPKSQKLVGEP